MHLYTPTKKADGGLGKEKFKTEEQTYAKRIKSYLF